MSFEFATASRILFGVGKRTEVFECAASLGSRALLVTGKDQLRAEWLVRGLEAKGFSIERCSVAGEPQVGDAAEGALLARKAGAEMVIAIGGGSVVDAGKAIAALATNHAEITEYLEVIGAGRPLTETPLPMIAIPTTAGTGAEVTRNSVLASREHQVKVSLRSVKMLPRVAIVDPELTLELPPEITASTGLDALTQLIEPFLCNRANPVTDAVCREALPRVVKSLPVAFQIGSNVEARSEMALGSLFGGVALANAGLGAVHGFAAPIGGMFPAPHGAICASLLPHSLKMNLLAAQKRGLGIVTSRFDELGRILTGDNSARGNDAIQCVEALCSELGTGRLRDFGMERCHFEILTERAAASSSMKANPVQLTRQELTEILERAW